MRTEYTPAVARALEEAERLARQHGADTVQAVYVMLGLLAEEEGLAAQMLMAAGLDLPKAKAMLGNLIPPLSSAPTSGVVPLDRSMARMLADAPRLLIGSFDAGSLTSEQAVVAILHGDEAIRCALTSAGLSFGRLAERLPEIKGASPVFEGKIGTVPFVLERILDAAANRAREALRVVEDYCRFVLDDAFLCRSLKELRHELAAILRQDRALEHESIMARDTLQDVGTSVSTAAEQRRDSPLAVVQANCKRAQEALRSLEEFAKMRSPELGAALEALRYRCYSLERAIYVNQSARDRLVNVRLYALLSTTTCRHSLERTIEELAAGGVQALQLREKGMTDHAVFDVARKVRQLTRQTGILFIVNDRPDIARLVEADGVHLGQDELPVSQARRLLGPDALIGVSTHSIEQVRQAVLDGADYLGVGPTFPSNTKQFDKLAGLEFVRQVMAETTLPAFVIGGVTLENIGEVIAAGGRRIAVSAALCGADDPRAMAAAFRTHLDA